jgi:hypothetical protein
MKINSRALLQTGALLLLLSGPFVPTVSAASTIVAYSYAGTLKSVSAMAQLPPPTGLGISPGDFISGTFSYDSSLTGSGGVYNYTGMTSKNHTFKFFVFTNSSMTTQLFTDSYSGNVSAFFENKVVSAGVNQLATLSLLGDTIFKSAKGISGPTTPAFNLTLNNPTGAGGFSPMFLPNPSPTQIKSFVATNATLVWDPEVSLGGSVFPLSFTATITQFVPGLNGVPEPSSVVLAGLGMTACGAGVVVSRRKAGRPRGTAGQLS